MYVPLFNFALENGAVLGAVVSRDGDQGRGSLIMRH